MQPMTKAELAALAVTGAKARLAEIDTERVRLMTFLGGELPVGRRQTSDTSTDSRRSLRRQWSPAQRRKFMATLRRKHTVK